MTTSTEIPVVLRSDGGLATELQPATGVVYLANGDGDAIRLEGDEVQRAARLLIAAHVDRGRFASAAREVAKPTRGRE